MLGLAGCTLEAGLVYDPAPDTAEADRLRPAVARALGYLDGTEDELGLDVVAALQIYGEERADPDALAVAERRRARLSAGELERYGVLLEVDKTVFPPSALDGIAPSGTTPDPEDDLGDRRVVQCLDEVIICTVSPECTEYLELDHRWGYVLTHQAVTLLFARWLGCPLDVDVDARRHTFAANLVAEMRADPAPSDLAYERMAMLGHLGFARAIEPAWVDALFEAQTDEGCFPLGPDRPCHPHSTGVALWTLAHVP